MSWPHSAQLLDQHGLTCGSHKPGDLLREQINQHNLYWTKKMILKHFMSQQYLLCTLMLQWDHYCDWLCGDVHQSEQVDLPESYEWCLNVCLCSRTECRMAHWMSTVSSGKKKSVCFTEDHNSSFRYQEESHTTCRALILTAAIR